jgi:hypothetical protein
MRPCGEAMIDLGDHKLIRVEAVKAAWEALIRSNVHNHFMGYLCILEAAARQGTTSDLEVNFKSFFDRFLRAEGLSAGTPYLNPFRGSPPVHNRNVAGSYAGSSLRKNAPLIDAAEYKGGGRDLKISLRTGHVDAARRTMLHEKPLPGLAMASFLYRDYGISTDSASDDGLQEMLRGELGLDAGDYQKLFGTPISLEPIF